MRWTTSSRSGSRQRPDLDVSPTHTLTRIRRLAVLQAVSYTPIFTRYGLTWGEYIVMAALRRSVHRSA